MPPEIVRAVLSCLRRSGKLAAAGGAAPALARPYLSNEACVEAVVPRGLWAVPVGRSADWLEGNRWLERYQRAWTLRIEPGVGALGLAIRGLLRVQSSRSSAVEKCLSWKKKRSSIGGPPHRKQYGR